MKTLCFAAGVAALAAIAARITGAKLPADEYPMPVEGASKAIVRAVVQGPRFHPMELFAAIEDYHNPRVSRLREEYGLAGGRRMRRGFCVRCYFFNKSNANAPPAPRGDPESVRSERGQREQGEESEALDHQRVMSVMIGNADGRSMNRNM